MNKDDLDLLNQFKREQISNAASDLYHGLENRNIGFFKKNAKSKESLELFAEEEFIRKQEFREMRCEMPGIPRSTFLMVFSPDGTKVASTHGNHNIYITDLRNGRNLNTLVGHPRTPWCIAFHPTSDQIVASGCLGGQVRIWDLSGGSEVWTTSNQTVIASLAFHPNDRVLAIATYNCVYFWDWSKPEPFVSAATYNIKEKVRYVAFDALGHKLITGIANSPMTRWERVRAPVPVPRPEWCASPYRRRITQRLANVNQNQPSTTENNTTATRDPILTFPERERRISMCYRTLVREYEQLVHRYLQLYRSPTMIDRGTDPMEPDLWFNNSGTQTIESQPSTSGNSQANMEPQPSTSGVSTANCQPSSSGASAAYCQPSTSGASTANCQPSTSGASTANCQPSTSGASTASCQPSASGCNRNMAVESSQNQHTSSAAEKVLDEILPIRSLSETTESTSSQSSQKSAHNLLTPSRIFSVMKKPNTLIRGTQTTESRKHKVQDDEEPKEKRLKKSNNGAKTKSSKKANKDGKANSTQTEQTATVRKVVPIINVTKSSTFTTNEGPQSSSSVEFRMRSTRDDNCVAGPSGLNRQESTETEEEVNPEPSGSKDSLPSTSRDHNRRAGNPNQGSVDDLLSNIKRTAEEEVRNRILPIIRSLPATDRPELIRLFENSREHVRMKFRQMYPNFTRKTSRRRLNMVDTTSDSSSSEEETNNNQNQTFRHSANNSQRASANSADSSISNSCSELERLVVLLTELEDSGIDRGAQTSREREINENHTNFDTSSVQNTTFEAITSSSDLGTHLIPPTVPSETAPEHAENVPDSLRNFMADWARDFSMDQSSSRDTSFHPPATIGNTNTRTTNSTIYTSNTLAPRRRFFSHRISAFMPTRVNSIRHRRMPHYLWGRSRLRGARPFNSSTFGMDELFNYSELDNSEEDFPLPVPPPPPDSEHTGLPATTTTPSDLLVYTMYSNIVRELESSLENVVRMRVSTRLGDTSNMLSNFTDRLENVLSQSDAILRSISSHVNINNIPVRFSSESSSDPIWSYFDSNHYVRERSDNMSPEGSNNSSENINLFDIFSPRPSFSAVASDHTYPRSPEDAHYTQQVGQRRVSLVATIHFTTTHIQRQARLLRQQVENIERIDRAMLEVEQLQLIRRLIVEMIRHVGALEGTPTSDTRTGVSSVRQMMAGTRISDSSPHESGAEEASTSSSRPNWSSRDIGEHFEADRHRPEGGNSSGEASGYGNSAQNRPPRSGGRKTYPPSRMYRLARQCRRPSVLRFFLRPYTSNRSSRHTSHSRNTSRSGSSVASIVSDIPLSSSSTNRYQSFSSYSIINDNTMNLMTRRLEQLLTEEMAAFSMTGQSRQSSRSTSTIDLGEHILALRLHGCMLRMNRVLGHSTSSNTIGLFRADPTAAVTQDGVSRYGARHTLSLIIDSMSRHVEESGNTPVPPGTQMPAVLAMSLLLTELMFLVVVDSIPPPTGVNLTNERVSLTSRIDRLCGQMLQSRQCSYSSQMTRSLRLMKMTMRHAQSALGQTYHARRNTLVPRHNTDRRMLLGSINRCLRTIRRQRQSENTSTQEASDRTQDTVQENATTSSSFSNTDWFSSISDLIAQISATNNEDETSAESPQPSTSFQAPGQMNDVSSNNDNSDDDDDDTDGYGIGGSNLYRTSNINLSPGGGEPGTANASVSPPASSTRPWNVPMVAVNDVPVSEQSSTFAQRLINQRARFAEHVSELHSELRSNPRIGLFRPRFLHPLYASVNPFDADLDDAQREQIYDSDMITTVTPNHRIQAWNISDWSVPNIGSATRNLVVMECKIHNDASVDIAKDGTILVTLLPSGGYLNVTNRLGVYSLKWETLGQCLYTTSFEQNAVSVSLSPLSRHLVVGLASRIVPSDRWIMARVFKIHQKDEPSDRLPIIRELEQNRDSRINCIRWLPISGQGLIYATNTGQLVVLT